MKMGLIGAVVGLVLSLGGIHIQSWEWWVVMACMGGAYAIGALE